MKFKAGQIVKLRSGSVYGIVECYSPHIKIIQIRRYDGRLINFSTEQILWTAQIYISEETVLENAP